MKYSFAMFVIHVAGTRMIFQGIDRLSRGILNKDALATGLIKLYARINLTALERSPGLEDWIKKWMLPDIWILKPE